jgi:hypothetical protein
MRWLAAPLAAIVLLTAACDGQDTRSGDASQSATEDVAPDDVSDTDDERAEVGVTTFDPWHDHPLAPEPGRWVVADAGSVEFDLTDQGLVLVEVTETDGWRSRTEEESSGEIEVVFHRDEVQRVVEVEWDGAVLEIDIDTDIARADDGVHRLGPAGSFEFSSADGVQLPDVAVADGWELRMDDVSSEEIEFIVGAGDERWRVEIELDDGRVELEIDYRVRGNPSA